MLRSDAGRTPLITAFYSFKGGVGRSLAAYNTALRVAARQQRVLLVDADLEAPGLTLALVPSDKRRHRGGFAEVLADVVNRLQEAFDGQAVDSQLPGALAREVESQAHAIWHMKEPSPLARSLAVAFPAHAQALSMLGSVSLLAVGQVHLDFAATLRRLDAVTLFDRQLDARHEPLILEPLWLSREECPTLGHVAARLLRAALASPSWDQVFIDSRTGLAEIGGICFRHVADRRVVVSGLNRQNIEGTRLVLDHLLPEMRAASELTVVLSPVPNGELELLRERHEAAAALFGTEPLTLPYVPRLALIEEAFTGDAYELSPLAQAYDRLAERVLAMTGRDAETLLAQVLTALAPELGTESGLVDRRALAEVTRHGAVRGVEWDEVVPQLLQLALASHVHARDLVSGMAISFTSTSVRGPLPERLEFQLRDLMQLWPMLEDDADADRLATLATGLSIGAYLLGPERGRALFHQASEKYARALELKPHLPDALYNWGNMLAETGRLVGPDESRPFFEQAFEKYARALELKNDLYQVHCNWGTALADFGQIVGPDEGRPLLEEACKKYARALEIKPDLHEALYNWANTLYDLAKLMEPAESRRLLEQACEKYSRALDVRPDRYEALHNWGNALCALAMLVEPAKGRGLFDEAVEKYARAAAFHPWHDDAWVNHLRKIADLGPERLSAAARDRVRDLLEQAERARAEASGPRQGDAR